jgi:hypothetical protein
MKSKLQNWFIGMTVATILATISIVWFGYINATNDRLYFSITQFDLPNSNDFTIGENSDVCFKGIPEKYMTVSYDKGAFSYKINNTDSCLYYKINNENINLYEIGKNSIITIFNIRVTGDYILRRLKDFDDDYYMLKDLFADRLTLKLRNSVNNGEIEFNSFIQKKNGEYRLVILDKSTRINNVGYCYSKTLSQGSELKIQFFKMKSWSIKKQEKGFWDNKNLSDNIRTYFAKPVQVFTDWGAGHILIKRNDSHFSVIFPKAITTTIPIDGITKASGDSSKTGVYLKQMLRSYYPLPTDFYIPAFSNALSEYVCELSGVKKNNLIFQELEKKDTLLLSTSGSFIPKINAENQQLVAGGITYKTRVLNKAFYWSKHWVLAVVWLVLGVVLFLSFPESGGGSQAEKVQDMRWYILGMFTLFWFFLNQKLLIAEKLTFTYPYFENIYPVAYLTNLFSLFTIFLLIIVINRSFLNNTSLKYITIKKGLFSKTKKDIQLKINYNWIWKSIISIFIIFLCVKTYNSITESFVSPIWNSYLKEEISFLDPLSNAIKDNHFSVFYFVGCALFVLMLIFNLSFLEKAISWIEKKFSLIDNMNLKFQNIKMKLQNINLIYRIIIIGIIIGIFIGICVFVLRENYSTALAVLTLLIVLSRLMEILAPTIPAPDDRYMWKRFLVWEIKCQDNPDYRPFKGKILYGISTNLEWYKTNLLTHKLWLWIVVTLAFVCLFVLIGISDFGFFVNIFGIAATWIFLIFCFSKVKSGSGKNNIRILNWNFGLGLIVGILVMSFVVVRIFNLYSNTEKIDYSRGSRRIQNCISSSEVKKAGYLYSESDMQWMEVMRYYAEKVEAGRGKDYDIYSEDNNFHSLVSTGQSPVILNDVGIPGVYLGSMRGWGWFGLLFGVFALGFFVYLFSIGDTWRQEPRAFTINRQLIGQLLAGNLWIGVTLYLLASYYWIVPFTGRLIPGFGVDAVGEALEIIVLFAFMCTLNNPYNQDKK